MGAKIVLSGEAKDVQKREGGVSFTIVTGPAARHPPRGLKLFGPTRYQVQCTVRQWRRARHDPDDRSDLVVEGYLEPRRDPDSAQLYVAVVAMSVQSTLAQNCRKLQQLEDVLEQARQDFQQAREAGVSHRELEEKAFALVKADESVAKFLQCHPELAKRKKN
jgi:hypothetical protein